MFLAKVLARFTPNALNLLGEQFGGNTEVLQQLEAEYERAPQNEMLLAALALGWPNSNLFNRVYEQWRMISIAYIGVYPCSSAVAFS